MQSYFLLFSFLHYGKSSGIYAFEVLRLARRQKLIELEIVFTTKEQVSIHYVLSILLKSRLN